MDLPAVLVLGLATYSVARLVAKERGPFDALKAFRALFQKKDNWIAEGVACIPCLSFWFGLLFAALVARDIIQFFIYGFAARGVSIFIGRFLGDIK